MTKIRTLKNVVLQRVKGKHLKPTRFRMIAFDSVNRHELTVPIVAAFFFCTGVVTYGGDSDKLCTRLQPKKPTTREKDSFVTTARSRFKVVQGVNFPNVAYGTRESQLDYRKVHCCASSWYLIWTFVQRKNHIQINLSDYGLLVGFGRMAFKAFFVPINFHFEGWVLASFRTISRTKPTGNEISLQVNHE